MIKKRVYELAKELGLENKELISRMEKMGITAKSHSSTLEDGDVERITREIRGVDSREMEEKRITSTIIRRRAVRPTAEEEKAEAPEESAPEAAAPAEAEGPPPEKKEEIKVPTAEPVGAQKPAVKIEKPVEKEIVAEEGHPPAAKVKETETTVVTAPASCRGKDRSRCRAESCSTCGNETEPGTRFNAETGSHCR